MGRKCIVCKIPEIVNSGVSFHSFPKEQGLKQLWMNECQIKLCLPSYRVCSNHFSPQHILTNGLLKKNAVPSVRLSAFAATSQFDEHSVPDSSTQNASDSMLDPTELSVVNVGPDSITSQINETDEAIVVEHDHSYFQSLKRLSPLVENISEYIGGFVVKKTLKKINCAICQQSLYKTFTNNILINLKDRNDALIKPSRDVVDICLIAERVFRSCDNIFKNNIKNSLFTKIKRHIYSSTKKIFQELDDHCLSQNLFNNHRDQLIALIIYIYLDVRLHHAAKESNHNKIKLRQKLTKLILFRNE